MISLDRFIEKYLGKKLDYDGVWDGQCVDLYRFYVKEVWGFEQSVPVGGAAEIWDTAQAKYYEFFNNHLWAVPQKGDIVIWNRNVGGGFGHVAIFLEGNVMSFTSLDQNWPTLSEVTKTKHSYDNVIGWLRPRKDQSMGDQSPELKECLNQHGQLVDKAVKLETELGEVRAEFKAATEDFRRDKERLANEAKARNEEYKGLQANVANELGTTLNDAQIIAELSRLVDQEGAAQKAIDTLREEEVRWNSKRIELNGEILKLKEQLKTDDLSKHDFEVLLNALVKKVVALIKSR